MMTLEVRISWRRAEEERNSLVVQMNEQRRACKSDEPNVDRGDLVREEEGQADDEKRVPNNEVDDVLGSSAEGFASSEF